MKYNYTLSGMTCTGCVARVKESLYKIESIAGIEVNLEKGEALIAMQRYVETAILQQALPDKYRISEKNAFAAAHETSEIPAGRNAEIRQLFPLFLILGYIAGASALLNINPWNSNGFMLDFMGLFYIVFSFFKLLDLKNFPDSFAMYDPLAKQFSAYGWVYPFVEVALGLLFLMRVEIKVALIATLVVLGITTLGVARVLLAKKTIHCACLGTVLKLPMTKATLIENALMIVMALLVLYPYFF